eukprot:2401887-Pleurochrysis_carterae.AAC.1
MASRPSYVAAPHIPNMEGLHCCATYLTPLGQACVATFKPPIVPTQGPPPSALMFSHPLFASLGNRTKVFGDSDCGRMKKELRPVPTPLDIVRAQQTVRVSRCHSCST